MWSLFIQMLLGLKSLHDRNILHRDLKGANIFMCSRDFIKLGDFGVSKVRLQQSFSLLPSLQRNVHQRRECRTPHVSARTAIALSMTGPRRLRNRGQLPALPRLLICAALGVSRWPHSYRSRTVVRCSRASRRSRAPRWGRRITSRPRSGVTARTTPSATCGRWGACSTSSAPTDRPFRLAAGSPCEGRFALGSAFQAEATAMHRRPRQAESMDGLARKIMRGAYEPIPPGYSKELQVRHDVKVPTPPLSRHTSRPPPTLLANLHPPPSRRSSRAFSWWSLRAAPLLTIFSSCGPSCSGWTRSSRCRKRRHLRPRSTSSRPSR